MTLDWAANFRGAARPQFRGLPPVTRVSKTVALGVLVIAVVLAMAYFAVLRPRTNSVDKVNTQAAAVTASNNALRTQIAQRHQQEAQLPQLRALSSAIDSRFPPTAEQAKLFKMITAAGAAAGIPPQYLTNLTVTPPADASPSAAGTAHLPGVGSAVGQVAAQTVTLNAKGTPAQIRAFVANLEKLPRAFEVTAVNLNMPTQSTAAATTGTTAPTTVAAPDANLTQATITGQMFLMPSIADPTKSAAAGTTAAGSTAAAAK